MSQGIKQTRLEGTSEDHPVQSFVRKKRGCGNWAWQIRRRDKFGNTSLPSPTIKIEKRDPNVPCCYIAKGTEAKDTCFRKGVSH